MTSTAEPERRTKVAMKPSTLQTIREGLRKVVEAGTGAGLNGPGIPRRLAKPERLKTAPEGLITPGSVALPRIPTARSWWWPLPRHPWRWIGSRLPMAKKVLAEWSEPGSVRRP